MVPSKRLSASLKMCLASGCAGCIVPSSSYVRSATHASFANGTASALEMTMNVYAHVTLDGKREALDKLNELFREDSS
jgi:hypothetical protein